MSKHEGASGERADLSGAGHPTDFMAAYAAAWRRGDDAAAATAKRRGMKPAADRHGRLPDWWERPWEGDGDLSDLREADADEMGNEVLRHETSGEPTGIPAAVEAPDVAHPAVAAHLVEEASEEAADAEATAPAVEGDEEGDEVDLDVEAEPPPAPCLHHPPPDSPVQGASGEGEGEGEGDVYLSPRSLVQSRKRARDAWTCMHSAE